MSKKTLIHKIESIVTNDISIIYILLAIILGLFICSVINQRTEGLDTNKDKDETKSWDMRYKEPTDKDGICYSVDKKNKKCEKHNETGDKDSCVTDKEGCNWINCGNDPNIWNEHIIGNIHDNLVKCLSRDHVLPEDGMTPWETDSTLIDIRGNGDKKPDRFMDFNDSKNFLHYVGCKYINKKVNCSTSKLPMGVRKNIENLANKCIGAWNTDFSRAYEYNGKGPIMSLNKKDGLKCLNPIMEEIKLPGGMPRLINSHYCKKCPCINNVEFEYENNPSKLTNIMNTLADNTTSSACGNVYHKNDPDHYYNCLTTRASDFIGGHTKNIYSKISGALSITDSCSSK
jgi:hypothetical protein